MGEANFQAPLTGGMFLWEEGVSHFFRFPSAVNNTGGTSINDRGQIVGAWDGGHGFLTTTAFGATTAITAPGYSNANTVAYGINEAGEIVGHVTANDGIRHAFLRNTDGSFLTFDYPGAVHTWAFGNNDLGQIVGTWRNDNTGTIPGGHGWIRDASGRFSTFDVPLSVGTGVADINDASQIVGIFQDMVGRQHGFIRYAGGTIATIDVPGSVLTSIRGNNDAGQITGYWIDNAGLARGFIGTPVGQVQECDEENNFFHFVVPGTAEIRGTKFNDADGDGKQDGKNLIRNTDFENGRVDFTTQLIEAVSLGAAGVFAIGRNPRDHHGSWASFGDHTTGSGLMMIINGAISSNSAVWTQTIEVTANTEYRFGLWASSSHPQNPARIQFFVNGEMIGLDLQLPSTLGQWQFLSATWVSGNETTATVSIRNFVPAHDGNDFVLDDIVFATTDLAEPGIANWTIYIDKNVNGLRDPDERFTLTDANGNYSFPNLAAGTYVVGEEMQSGWRQTSPLGGTYTVTVNAGQAVTGIDFGNQQTNEPPTNRSPSFITGSPASATIGQLLRYNARATDPDNDPLSYDLVVKPTGMAVQPETGIVVWIPSADQVGPHDVTLRVSDGRGGVALQSFVITVSMANSTPVITSRPKGPAVVGLPYEYRATAQDADGDPIVFSLGAHPAGMTIDAASGLVRWTPAANQVGSPHVEVTASDNRGAATTQSFDLPTVATAANRSPNITSTPRGSIRLGSQYLYAVIADDPDGDPLVYSLPKSPTGMTIDPSTGLVTWTPTANQMGANAVEVKVDDGRGAAVIQSFTITVQNQSVKRPPNITSNPPAVATVGRSVAYDVVATDPDGDPLAFSLDVFPAGMSISPSAGTIRWIPTADQLGVRNVVVRVIDGQGGFATQSFTINVRAVNTPPNVTSTPPTFASIGNAYSYAVRATDIDGDSLTFAAITMPTGMTIDSQSGLIRWTPAANQLGSHDVAFRVDDGQGGTATQIYTLVVTATAANNPPVITSNPSFVATVDTLYQYNVTATDADGDTLTYQLQNPPAGMAINSTTGVVTWTPTATQLGTHTITVAAIDGQAGGTQTYTLRVANTNRHPTITSQPPPGVVAGLVYRYDVRASDPDGDPITYKLDSAPAGMTIDNLGRISWPTTKANVGTHRVAVSVEDNRGLLVTQTFDMVVLADGKTPLVNLIVRPGNRVAINSVVTIVVTATDNVGVKSIGLKINGNPVPLDAAGRVSFIATPVGLYDIVASATDDAGNTGLASTQILVFDNSDQVPPVVEVTSPLDNAIVSAPTDVVGTVTDANLAFYTLSVAPVGSDTFTELVRKTTSVTAGVLGKFDPTGLANDSYILRLEATDTGGNISYVDTLVQVAGDLKIGNFTLSFTDLTVPVSGIPITVSRTYDTLQANQQDDFGFGWRLEFRDTNLRTSVPSSGAEEYGSFTPYNDGARVYVTAPGGRREGFTFRPRLVSGFGALVGFYNPVFVPDRGVTSQLSVNNFTLIRSQSDGLFYGANGLAYNPTDELNFGGRFYLTTKDGIAYEIDANSGDLVTLSDASRNVLTFTEAAIESNRGPRITFQRDPQGRITSVTDPSGNRVRYQYDSKGDLISVTDRDNNVTQFIYAEPRRLHFLTEIIDPLGRTGVRTEYDAQGRLIKLIDAAGNPVQLIHDPDNSTETVTDALGNSTSFVYDLRGNVVTEVDAAGGTARRTYDSANNMLTERDPLGNVTTFTYDGDGNLLTETDPLGNVTRNTYTTTTPGFFDRIRGARGLVDYRLLSAEQGAFPLYPVAHFLHKRGANFSKSRGKGW